MAAILVIEDDRVLAAGLSEFLRGHGMAVDAAADAATALAYLERRTFDMILLDLSLPDLDGLALMQRLRQRCRTPVIIITARGDDTDKILGLELGADDYLAKPFNLHELLARIRAVLRRAAGGDAPERIVAADLSIDLAAREVRLGGSPVLLTSHEFDVLAVLARHPGRVLSRERLLTLLKGEGADEVFERAIDVVISRLRQKIEHDPRQPRFLKTVRGVGYAFNRAD